MIINSKQTKETNLPNYLPPIPYVITPFTPTRVTTSLVTLDNSPQISTPKRKYTKRRRKTLSSRKKRRNTIYHIVTPTNNNTNTPVGTNSNTLTNTNISTNTPIDIYSNDTDSDGDAGYLSKTKDNIVREGDE